MSFVQFSEIQLCPIQCSEQGNITCHINFGSPYEVNLEFVTNSLTESVQLMTEKPLSVEKSPSFNDPFYEYDIEFRSMDQASEFRRLFQTVMSNHHYQVDNNNSEILFFTKTIGNY